MTTPNPTPRGITGRLSAAVNWLFPPMEDDPAMPPVPKQVLVAPEASSLLRTLADIGVHMWRMQKKMIDPATGEARDEMSGPYRQVEAIFESLQAAHIRVVDPTGQPFQAGMPLRVLAFQPTPGLTQETILETLVPMVIYQTAQVGMGEVIVGTPIKPESALKPAPDQPTGEKSREPSDH